jgi:hypothetical protein
MSEAAPFKVKTRPAVEFIFCDPIDPDNEEKQVRVYGDVERLARQFEAVIAQYQSNPDDPVSDYDVIGVRVDAYGQIIKSLGAVNGKSIPPQNEADVLFFVESVFKMAWDRMPEELKKKIETERSAALAASGRSNSNSEPSPLAPSSATT